MRRGLCVGAALLGLVGFGAAARAGDEAPKYYTINCRMVEYDWNGKKTHEENFGITTLEGRPASGIAGQTRAIVNGGGQEFIDVGASFRFVVRGLNGGRVRLDSTAEYSWLESEPNSNLRMQSVAKRSIDTLRLGEVYRIELQNSEKDGSGRAFVITVEEPDAAVKK